MCCGKKNIPSEIIKRMRERKKEIKKLWNETKNEQGNTIVHIPAETITNQN